MAVTTVDKEYDRLRSYLNPLIRGPVTTAVLTALATGNSSYLVNNVAAVNDQLYIATASGVYLDQRLAEYGITRPPALGLADDIYRQIGIAVKNRKQVRDLMNNILSYIFGDQFVRATNDSTRFAPYNLVDGDTLIINFDENHTTTIIFKTSDFESIAAATAQEVADAITKYLRNIGQTGSAIAKNDGNGDYVELISDTIGASSSVTVMGGSAQNQFQFPTIVPAGGNMSTQWTLSLRPGGIIRFTWTGGANPNLGKVIIGNYVIISGGGFASSPNEGSYPITAVVGGIAGSSYFEVLNPLGTSGMVVQGVDNAVMFYNPTKETLLSRISYAMVFQTQPRVLQVFLPAATKVIRRGRIGSAHIHYPPQGTFTLNSQPVDGDVFSVDTVNSFVAGTDFVIGMTIRETVQNIVDAINAAQPLVVAIPNGESVLVDSNSTTVTLTMAYTGAQAIVGSGPMGDNTSLLPNQPGPYLYDTTQPFVISSVDTKLAQQLDATSSKVISVDNSSQFPDGQGYILLGYGTDNQEGPIPYIARPSDSTILLSPAYMIQKIHPAGEDVALIAQKAPVVPSPDGTAYQGYITGIVDGRIYAQNLIESVAATGIAVIITILYPSDVGLGRWSTIYTENSIVWGE